MRNKVNLIPKKRIFFRSGRAAVIGCLFICVLSGCTKKQELPIVQEADAFRTDAALAALTEAETAAAAEASAVAEEETPQFAPDIEVPMIRVHVCGAVTREGVYTLSPDSRVVDAVRAAGGFLETADASFVNQAAFLTDGMKIRIPTYAEVEALSATEEGGAEPAPFVSVGLPELVLPDAGQETAETDSRININTATAEELCTLSGIGAGRAADIIAYREQHGAFTRIEDVMQVSGIKERVFERIRDRIRVS